jgi:transaldolase
MSKMKQTSDLGTDFWNDSCDPKELTEAIAHGAVGATSNPVIVSTVVQNNLARWGERIDSMLSTNPEESENEIAWRLIAEVGAEAAQLLYPVFERYGGRKGRLSIQVNPTHYRNPAKMVAQAQEIAGVAANLAIKAPVTDAGIRAMEEMTARGISVTATVSFTVPQAIASAEAIERGLESASHSGHDTESMSPSVVIMVGRLDDHLKRVMQRERITVDPGILEWAGIAVVKKLYGIFAARGYRSKLLAAAYRNPMQWSELTGGNLILTLPYKWWKQFNASNLEVVSRIDVPVEERILQGLSDNFHDFRRAYDEKGMAGADFLDFGATVHTLNQFISGYYQLLELVRSRMLRV